MAKKSVYDNESIIQLKGADKVRKRPAVIFGSDGLEGCEHSIFEIISKNKSRTTTYRNACQTIKYFQISPLI